MKLLLSTILLSTILLSSIPMSYSQYMGNVPTKFESPYITYTCDESMYDDIINEIIQNVRERTSKSFKIPFWLISFMFQDDYKCDLILEDIRQISNMLIINTIDEIDDMKPFKIHTDTVRIILDPQPIQKPDMFNTPQRDIGKTLLEHGFPLYDVSFEYEYNYYKAFIDVLGYDDISPKIKDRTYVILSTQFIPQVNQKCACAEYLSISQLEQLDNELTSLMKQYNINKLSDVYTSFQ